MRLNLKWAVCFKAEIKPLDFIIDCKFSGLILPSAEARGKIPVEAKAGKRMCVLQLIDIYNWKVTHT